MFYRITLEKIDYQQNLLKKSEVMVSEELADSCTFNVDLLEEAAKQLVRKFRDNGGNVDASRHLQWMHDRMVNVYHESENVDFLIKLREIIKTLQK
jgi:uncharacterized protein with HEPN domain